MPLLDRKTPPAVKGFGDMQIPEPRHLTLDNGVPLTVLDNGSQEVNRLTLVWDGGICETSFPAIATLAANLMREGTLNHSGAEIAETLEYNGAWIKGSVHSHHSSVVAYSLNSKAENVFPVIAETISCPVFPERETSVLREKMARTAELDREKVEFYSALENRRLVMGENHPLAHSDTPQEIRDITSDDIKALHNDVYTPATCGIYLSGCITPEIEDIVNNRFGSIKSDSHGCKINIVPFTGSANHLSVIRRKGALQSAIRLSIPTIGREHPDYIPLRIAVMALGGYFGSRLMSNIREDKGYTYGISASLLGYHEGGIISIATQCDNRYTMPLIEEVKKELTRMTTGDFSLEELDRLKKYAMTQLATILDSPFTIMDYYENMRLASTPENYFEDQIDAITSITPQQIASLASRYLPLSDLYISIAGDNDDITI